MKDDKAQQSMIQNLKDAGCDSNMIEQFLACHENGNVEKQQKLLSDHRRQLLERVHTEEKKIDCLDYLDYQLRKEKMRG